MRTPLPEPAAGARDARRCRVRRPRDRRSRLQPVADQVEAAAAPAVEAAAAHTYQPVEKMKDLMEFCRTHGLENTTKLFTIDGITQVGVTSEVFIEFSRHKGRDSLAEDLQEGTHKLQKEWAQEDKEKNIAAHMPTSGQFNWFMQCWARGPS